MRHFARVFGLSFFTLTFFTSASVLTAQTRAGSRTPTPSGDATRPRSVSEKTSPAPKSPVEVKTTAPVATSQSASSSKNSSVKTSTANVAAPKASPTPNSASLIAPNTNANALPPVRTNTIAPVVVAPLLPVKSLPANSVRAHIGEAQRLLATRPSPVVMTMTPTPTPTPFASTSTVNTTTNSTTVTSNATLFPSPSPTPAPFLHPTLFVTLAAIDPEAKKTPIHLITLPKETFLTRGASATVTTSLGTLVRVQILRANGVNTAVVVSELQGHQLTPLLVQYPVEKGGSFREMAYYTSAHPALLSPELVNTGQNYVRTMLDFAAKQLRDRGIFISPQIVDVAERLCVVEHVDHDRFRREDRKALYEEIYSLYALNEQNTYRFSVSTAGAGGMVQMIPSTYQMIRRGHPSVGLNPDFVPSMRNHGTALQAMLLYMQDTWNTLTLSEEINNALLSGLATQPELLAAGYNSNPAHLARYLKRGGTEWRNYIPRETQMYLQIYSSVEALMPFKSHVAK